MTSWLDCTYQPWTLSPFCLTLGGVFTSEPNKHDHHTSGCYTDDTFKGPSFQEHFAPAVVPRQELHEAEKLAAES